MSNTQANLGKLWIFDPTKNRWASYESMLRRILAARTIEADGEKKVFLFNHIGPAAYESQHMQPYCPKRGQRQPPTNQGYQRRQNGRNSGIRAVLPESRYDSEVSSDDDDACLALGQEVEVRRVSIPPVWLKVKLNDIEIAMELDSGAVRSVIPKPVWEKIGRPKISSYTGELQGYGGKPLNVLGTAYIDASFGKHSVLTEMVIVRDRKGQALFGRDLIRDLKVDMGPHVQNVIDYANQEFTRG
uniref:Peptidase A2 domain-containing protein n=1 Tax=Bursaphelenchus xylophilus TaxID=6326 RepID=A0A1I7S5E1_BURXY